MPQFVLDRTATRRRCTLYADVGCDYYKLGIRDSPPEKDADGEDKTAPPPRGLLPTEVDLLRVRLKEGNITGTLRTREGYGDHCIPATKVALLLDMGRPRRAPRVTLLPLPVMPS